MRVDSGNVDSSENVMAFSWISGAFRLPVDVLGVTGVSFGVDFFSGMDSGCILVDFVFLTGALDVLRGV